jgi:hypothetical protein
MILFQEQIQEHQELASHYRELASQREALAAGLLAVQRQADSDLSSLKLLVDKCKEVAPSAITSLKTAVLTLFSDDDGTGDNGNQPNDPAPDTDPSPECDPDDDFDIIALNGETGDCQTTDDLEALGEDDTSTGTARLTYAQVIKKRCSACWGYEVTSKADIKAGFVNRTSLDFMEAVNLERSGKDFYQTVEAYLDRLYYNGQACQLEDCPESSRTGQSYEWATSFACLLWEDVPLLGQACVIEVTPYVELVKVSDALAYQRKHDGEIVCTYIGFKTKAIAQSWLHFFEAITSKVELRQALRVEAAKWEIKAKGLSINQIERYAKDCDFTKSYQRQQAETPAQAAGIEPPSGWGKPQQPDPMTCILAKGDTVEVISHRHPAHHGLIGTVEAIARFSELSFQVKTPRGTKGYERGDLKFISKAQKPQQQPTGLQAGTVLMGNRILTTGNYAGQARRNSISMARMGTENKVAALELVKAGLSREEAMAAVTGTAADDLEF